MQDPSAFGLLVLTTGAAGLAAVLSNRLSQRVRVPAPALFLAAAAIAVAVVPGLESPPEKTVERLVTVALICILFDGGMHMGWPRFRAAAAPIALVGVLGTFVTVGAAAAFVHVTLGLSWYVSLLIATAVAPTDPAVVFSVLGQREVEGRSGTILEGESGANDPVGIALMASLLAAGSLSGSAFAEIGAEFALQMAVGAAAGLVGGRGLLWFMRHVPLPNEALYSLRTLAFVLALFGATTLAQGSGFLAVFLAGIVVGEARAPYKREIERFHGALAGLAEIVAFVVLGLTVSLEVLTRTDVWVPGLALALVLAVVIRPLLVGPLLLPARLTRNENAFVLFAGLKGAVPLLLGSFLLTADVADAPRLYGIVVVVVVFSVVLQGGLVPTAARLLRLSMRQLEPEPWSLGVRLSDEPDGVHRLTVAPGSAADGRTLAELTALPEDVWVSFVVRQGQLVTVRGDTVLQSGDEVLVLAAPASRAVLEESFEGVRRALPE